jgi:hypothetical protein
MSRDVFVSYCSEDHAVATSLCCFLEQHGVQCWIAPRDIAPGQAFDEAIIDAIDGTQALIVVLSDQANRSPFVKNEVNRAFAKGRAIFTVRTESVLPGKGLELYLARHHWTDGFPPPIEQRLDRLTNAILALLGRGPVAATAVEALQSALPAEADLQAPPAQKAQSRVDSPAVTPASPASKAASVTRFAAEVTLATGDVLAPCEVFDHNPGPIGSGWDEKRVALCRSIEEAAQFKLMGDAATVNYADILRVDVLAMSADEQRRLHNMANSYYREKIIKCNLTMRNGTTKTEVFLLPNYLQYVFEYETHHVRAGQLRSIHFCS